MAEAFVKLRSDLEIHQESNGSVIVKDPITHGFYRFTPVQASVLEHLDGRQDFESIASVVAAKHQTEVLEEQLKDFTGKLQTLLLLDHPYCWAKLEGASRKRRHRILRNLLFIKIHAFNPDALLDKLERRLRFCFSPGFAATVWILVAVALILSILNWESLFLSLGTVFTLYSIPLIVVIVFAIVTIHEFAHGLTLKHFGGKVDEMGFMILYFIPAFYCNVSDAWLLKKRERILVSFAGGYVQFFIWALAIIFWRLLALETFGSQVCLIIIAFCGIQTFLNFNPLIRLDGYYMLSDFLEVPNLRPKAIAYVKNWTRSLLTGTPFVGQEGLNARQRGLFFFYGSASALFTCVLVWIMVQRLGGWIVEEYHFWGILLVSVLFFVAMPSANKENRTVSGKGPPTVKLRIRKFPIALLILILIVIASFLPWELKISGDFTINASKKVAVTPQVSGNLKKIYVEQGNQVRKGDLLAEIENLELSNSYEETKGELATQRAALDLLLAGSRPEEIEKARRLVETKKAELFNASRNQQERAVLLETIAKKEAELENARLVDERTQRLLEGGLIARNEADRTRIAYEVQKKELSEAKGQLKVLEEQTDRNSDIKRKELEESESELSILRAGSRKESIRAVESQVNKLEEKLSIFERQLDLLKIRSPIDGVVATSYLQNRIGDFLDKGNVFCEIVSEGTVIVEMPVPEKEIGDVRLGYPISIKVRGYPNRWYRATVREIAPTAGASGVEKTVIVQGDLKNPDGSLKAGMTGVGKILCGQRTIFEIASRRAIRWLRTEFWEYLP
ncbi:MAG TPA: efflux RND transporter periplasmic adaptor subunit [Acidobacteriota bacterium]|nr:efflux RND transporter periplasmic adaptor subunit [Acidobacteriota bacterium]